MIEHMLKKSKDEIKALIDGLNITPKDENELFASLRTMSVINASAYKGYGKLSDYEEDVNRLVYCAKNRLLPLLFKIASDMGCDIGYKHTVLYYRHSNGIQLSYHYHPRENLLEGIRFTNDNPEWDRVKNSWTYDDPESYRKAIELYGKKFNAASVVYDEYISTIFDTLLDILKSASRRKSFGIQENIAWFRSNKKEIKLHPDSFDERPTPPDCLICYFNDAHLAYKYNERLFNIVADENCFHSWDLFSSYVESEVLRAAKNVK